VTSQPVSTAVIYAHGVVSLMSPIAQSCDVPPAFQEFKGGANLFSTTNSRYTLHDLQTLLPEITVYNPTILYVSRVEVYSPKYSALADRPI
jgi:hypothetical protein